MCSLVAWQSVSYPDFISFSPGKLSSFVDVSLQQRYGDILTTHEIIYFNVFEGLHDCVVLKSWSVTKEDRLWKSDIRSFNHLCLRNILAATPASKSTQPAQRAKIN